MGKELLRRMLLIACYRIFDSLKDSTTNNINVVEDVDEIVSPAKCVSIYGYSDGYKSFGYELKIIYKKKEYSLMFYFKDIDKCSINEGEIEQFVDAYMEDIANE